MHIRLIRGKYAHDIYSVCVFMCGKERKPPKREGGESHYCIMRILSLRRYINGEWGERQLRALLTDDNTIAEKNQPSYITYYRIYKHLFLKKFLDVQCLALIAIM